MSEHLDFPTRFDGPSTPWFADPAYRRIFSGSDYGVRCLAAIGPADFSRVAFIPTSNPRQRAWSMSREAGANMIVQECAWSTGRTSTRVHAEVIALLARTKVPLVDGFVTIPRTHLRPLLQHAAKKSGIPIRWHAEFHRYALDIETEKLRARLKKTGLSPAIVAAHYCV